MVLRLSYFIPAGSSIFPHGSYLLYIFSKKGDYDRLHMEGPAA